MFTKPIKLNDMKQKIIDALKERLNKDLCCTMEYWYKAAINDAIEIVEKIDFDDKSTICYADIDIKRIPVESSNVVSIGYHDKYKIMAIEMLNGIIYYYLDIPKNHFIEMTNANGDGKCHTAIGSYLHRNVKGKYRYIRIN